MAFCSDVLPTSDWNDFINEFLGNFDMHSFRGQKCPFSVTGPSVLAWRSPNEIEVLQDAHFAPLRSRVFLISILENLIIRATFM